MTSKNSSTQKAKALLIEADESQRRGITVALESFFAEFVSMANPSHALQELSRSHFDIVISDLHFPTNDGLSIITRCKELRPKLMLVIMVTQPNPETLRKLEDLGVDFILEKPINIEFLKHTIHTLLTQINDTEDGNE